MKIRPQKNFRKPENWRDFLRDMDLWVMVYDALAFLAKQKLIGTLALKAHVQSSKAAYREMLSEKEMSFFQDVLIAKTRSFDPDVQLGALMGQIVCIELNPQSHLKETYNAPVICGKFVKLNDGKATTMIKSEASGKFEERDAAFSITLAYPDDEHHVRVSLLDMVNIEPFL